VPTTTSIAACDAIVMTRRFGCADPDPQSPRKADDRAVCIGGTTA
jgi:hypothetical protein